MDQDHKISYIKYLEGQVICIPGRLMKILVFREGGTFKVSEELLQVFINHELSFFESQVPCLAKKSLNSL